MRFLMDSSECVEGMFPEVSIPHLGLIRTSS